MGAIRLCRYNTGKKLIVVFGGSYHGWSARARPRLLASVLPIPKQLPPNPLTPYFLRARVYQGGMVCRHPRATSAVPSTC